MHFLFFVNNIVRVQRYPTYSSNSFRNDSPHENLSYNLLATLLTHPLTVGNTLIHLGYEPISPTLGHTILSFIGLEHPKLMYPWLGKYVWNLYSLNILSLTSLFTQGIFATMMRHILSITNQRAVCDFLFRDPNSNHSQYPPHHQHHLHPSPQSNVNRNNQINISLEESLISVPYNTDFIKKLFQLICFKIYETILTQPFYVIAVRQIGDSVNKTGKYLWFHQAVVSIYRENGWRGFMQGLLPRIIGDCLCCAVYFGLNRLFYQCFVNKSSNIRSPLFILIRIGLRYSLSALMAPLRTVASVMAINKSSLKLATSCSYSSWVDCWSQLRQTDQLCRGNSFVWRRHVPVEFYNANQKD